MRKKLLWICIVTVLIGALGIYMVMLSSPTSKLSRQEAEKLLQEYLMDTNQWESDYVLEPLNPIEAAINNEDVYRFEIRYNDMVEQVGGRLIDNFAITDDGGKIFWYDPANDEWLEKK